MRSRSAAPAIDKETLKKLSVLRGRVTANASLKPYYSVRVSAGQTALQTLEEITAALGRKEEPDVPA